MSQSNESVAVTCMKCRCECVGEDSAEYIGQGAWICLKCGAADPERYFGAPTAGVSGPVGTVRRPSCSCCGYPAPLPTLRQFDGLCLGCYEEAESPEGIEVCWSCGHTWIAQHGDEPHCPKCDALLVG